MPANQTPPQKFTMPESTLPDAPILPGARQEAPPELAFNFALIRAGRVENVIVAAQSFADSLASDFDAVVPAGEAGIGWAWDGKAFTAPVPAPSEPAAPIRHISVGAFFDRFGSAKWGILASTDPTVKAVISDASVRKYIDLDNPALPMGVAIIHAAGFDVDGAAIIDAPVQPGEQA